MKLMAIMLIALILGSDVWGFVNTPPREISLGGDVSETVGHLH